jgi:hypothetical protein
MKELQAYLNPRATALYLSSSTSTLAKLRLRGGGPPFTRIGRAIRYRRSDLDAYMLAGLSNSTSDDHVRIGGNR